MHFNIASLDVYREAAQLHLPEPGNRFELLTRGLLVRVQPEEPNLVDRTRRNHHGRREWRSVLFWGLTYMVRCDSLLICDGAFNDEQHHLRVLGWHREL